VVLNVLRRLKKQEQGSFHDNVFTTQTIKQLNIFGTLLFQHNLSRKSKHRNTSLLPYLNNKIKRFYLRLKAKFHTIRYIAK